MDRNVVGVFVTFSFLFGVLIAAKVIMIAVKGISPEVVRKFIHIGVSNWWFIYLKYFDNLAAKLAGPVAFVIINTIATFADLTRYLGMNDRVRNYGLIYFPISLVILVCFIESSLMPEWAAGVGVLTMGYGDGLAAIIGRKFGRKKLFGKKTVAGSMTMFIVTFFVVLFHGMVYRLPWSETASGLLVPVITATAATLFEAITPFGLDNISVPIAAAIVVVLFGN